MSHLSLEKLQSVILSPERLDPEKLVYLSTEGVVSSGRPVPIYHPSTADHSIIFGVPDYQKVILTTPVLHATLSECSSLLTFSIQPSVAYHNELAVERWITMVDEIDRTAISQIKQRRESWEMPKGSQYVESLQNSRGKIHMTMSMESSTGTFGTDGRAVSPSSLRSGTYQAIVELSSLNYYKKNKSFQLQWRLLQVREYPTLSLFYSSFQSCLILQPPPAEAPVTQPPRREKPVYVPRPFYSDAPSVLPVETPPTPLPPPPPPSSLKQAPQMKITKEELTLTINQLRKTRDPCSNLESQPEKKRRKKNRPRVI